MNNAEAVVVKAYATGLTYVIIGLILLILFKLIAATIANWTLEGQFSRWRSDRSMAHGWSMPRFCVGALLFAVIAVMSIIKFARPDTFALLDTFPTDRNWRLSVGDGVQEALDWTKTSGRGGPFLPGRRLPISGCWIFGKRR